MLTNCINVSTQIISSTTIFNIDDNINVSLTSTYITIISEGSCDTEDQIIIENSYFKLYSISQY